MVKVFSMFSGIGGFEYGIHQVDKDAEFVGYSEIDKYAIQIFEKHYPGVKNYGDATTIVGEQLPDFDILVGGFPCQAFSIAGHRRGFLDDTRGTLFFDIARICSEKRPRCLVLENVKGLLSHDQGKTFQTILGVLADLGYDVEWQVLNSKNFGVPQNRERVYIVGHLGNRSPRKIFPIAPSHTETSIKRVGHSGFGGQKGDVLGVDGLSTALTATDYKQPKQIKVEGVLDPNDNNTHKNLIDIIDRKGKSKNKDIASTLTVGGHGSGNHSDMDLLVTPATDEPTNVMLREVRSEEAKELRKKNKANGKDYVPRREKDLVPRDDGLASSLISSRDNEHCLLTSNQPINLTSGNAQGNRVYDVSGITPTISAQGGGWGAKTGLYKIDDPAVKNPLKGKTEYGWHFEQNVYETDGISRSLKSSEGSGNKPKVIINDDQKPKILDASHRNEGIREYTDYSPTLNSRDYKEPRYVDEGNGMRIRRLTPTECERLQGFPDGWTEGLSDTQRYKTLGNAVTTNVVKAVMERLL